MNFLLYVKNRAIYLTLIVGLLIIPPNIAFGQSATIDVFVASRCRQCVQMEELLTGAGIYYRRIDLENDSQGEDDYLKNIGRGILPAVRIGKTIIRGYEPEQFLQAFRDAKKGSSIGAVTTTPPQSPNVANNYAAPTPPLATGNTNTTFSGGYIAPGPEKMTKQTNWDKDFKPYVPGASTSDNEMIALVVGAILFFLFYLTPSIIAFVRGHPNRYAITAVNICLGATGIVWIIALLWASNSIHAPKNQTSSSGGESGLNVFANDVKRVKIVKGDFADTADEINRLAALYKSGMIDEEEFIKLKKQAFGGGIV